MALRARRRLFAFLFGIDNYDDPKLSPLHQAIADANNVLEYLEKDLLVDPKQIRTLGLIESQVPIEGVTRHRPKPTREAIIQGIRDLQKDPKILRDDAIFIYFAGHGTRGVIDAPKEGGTAEEDGTAVTMLDKNMSLPQGKKIVEAIVPQDACWDSGGTQLSNVIWDHTLAKLLRELAEVKGNNITVIFDCCHSTSGTRDGKPKEGHRIRGIGLGYNITEGSSVGRGRCGQARELGSCQGFLGYAGGSHMFLAACGAEETAWENSNGGFFTVKLLAALREAGPDKLPYKDLISRVGTLRANKQNPQCEGECKLRIFLNAVVPGRDSKFMDIQQEPGSNNYMLKAGLAQGITDGSLIGVYADYVDVPSNRRMGILRVKSVENFCASLEQLQPLDSDTHSTLSRCPYARVVLARPAKLLTVHFKGVLKAIDEDSVQKAWLAADRAEVGLPTLNYEDFIGFCCVTIENKPEMIVEVNDSTNQVEFSFQNLAPKPYTTLLDLKVSATAEEVSRVLRSAARWHWHLERAGPPSKKSDVDVAASPDVDIAASLEITFLREKISWVNGEPKLTATVPDEQKQSVRVQNGVVDVAISHGQLFGIKIINETDNDLYPYLFHFIPRTLRIDTFYHTPTGGGRVDSPLKGGDFLKIGYGGVDEIPFECTLEGVKSKVFDKVFDVGFLKLFLTTNPTDFDSLEQKPLVGPDSPKQTPETHGSPRVIQRSRPLPTAITRWGTMNVTFVQHSS